MHVLHMRMCVHTCLHVMPITIMNVHIAGLHCRGALRATLRPAHRGRVRQRAPNTDGRSPCYAHTAAVLTAHGLDHEHMRALPQPCTAAAASPSPLPGSSPRSPPSASPPSARRPRTRTPRGRTVSASMRSFRRGYLLPRTARSSPAPRALHLPAPARAPAPAPAQPLTRCHVCTRPAPPSLGALLGRRWRSPTRGSCSVASRRAAAR